MVLIRDTAGFVACAHVCTMRHGAACEALVSGRQLQHGSVCEPSTVSREAAEAWCQCYTGSR